MAQGQFIVSDTNPNETTGGGGCICDESKQQDCKPPYIIISQNSMDSDISPYPVACRHCVKEWAKALDGEALRTGAALDGGFPRTPPPPADITSRIVRADELAKELADNDAAHHQHVAEGDEPVI
jgi:hypothetical protein